MPGEPVAPPSDGVFAVGRRGYDPQQVDAHLRRLDAEIRILVADRDAAVDQAAQLGRDLEEARLRADRLRTQVRTMAARPSDVQGMSERMRTMLRLAEDEVADMLRRADEEVARRLADADRTAEQVTGAARREAARIRSPRPRGGARPPRRGRPAPCGDRRGVRGGPPVAGRGARRRRARDRAGRGRSEQERASAWAESERRRATVEEDFSIAMDQRRAEALTAIQRRACADRAVGARHQGRGRPAGTRRDHGRRGDRPPHDRRGPGPGGRARRRARAHRRAAARHAGAALDGPRRPRARGAAGVSPAPAVEPAPRPAAVAARSRPPACPPVARTRHRLHPATGRLGGAAAHPAARDSAPHPAGYPRRPDCRPSGRRTSPAPRRRRARRNPVTQPVPDDAERRTPAPVRRGDVPEERPTPDGGEARRPTQRRRKRQNSGSRR